MDANFENLKSTADSVAAVVSKLNVNIIDNGANQVIDSVSGDSPKVCKYIIKVMSDVGIQMEEAIIVYDGSSSYISEYGLITTGDLLAQFEANFVSNSLNLLVTPLVSPISISMLRFSLD